jgi:hypothetical protein
MRGLGWVYYNKKLRFKNFMALSLLFQVGQGKIIYITVVLEYLTLPLDDRHKMMALATMKLKPVYTTNRE